MDKDECLSCVDCGKMGCRKHIEDYPEFCVAESLTDEEVDEVAQLYMDAMNKKISVVSAEIEGEFYGRYTRVEETVEFARRIGAHKIGIATCAGLIDESRVLAKIFRLNDFEVYSAICKTGSFLKKDIGVDEKYMQTCSKVMCNPIMQAKLLAKAQVDLNVVVGLCVGHDSLFYKYAEGVTTTLVTKDRVLGNNPVQALYLTGTYYKKLLNKKVGE